MTRPSQSARSRSARARASRRGFTLIELVVALVAVNVALLALVAGTNVVVRRIEEVRARTTAVQAAENRLQLLAAEACVPVAGAAAGAHDMVERWSAGPPVNGVRELADSVTFRVGTQVHALTLHSRMPC